MWDGSDKGCAARTAAAVVAVVVPAGQVGRSDERVSLVRTPVLKEDVHTLLTVSLTCIRQCCVAMCVPRHDVYSVPDEELCEDHVALAAGQVQGSATVSLATRLIHLVP